ncbi:MAG: helix-turn-helix domain-containing protein, partial [Acetomicrobium sp.]|nr:helix-turn-helix domain-containing protein [Acetomicrobium sp.]
MIEMEKLLTPKDAAEILSLSPVTIKKWLWQGQ